MSKIFSILPKTKYQKIRLIAFLLILFAIIFIILYFIMMPGRSFTGEVPDLTLNEINIKNRLKKT